MATQTVRTIYEADVARAQQRLRQLATELEKTGGSADKLTQFLDKAGDATIKPQIDVDIESAEDKVRRLRGDLEMLEALNAEPVVELDIAQAEAQARGVEQRLEDLSGMEASPVVDAETARAEGQLEGLKNRISGMEGLRAEVTIAADIDKARADLADAEADLRALQGRKAEMVVEVDSEAVEPTLAEAGESVEEGGESAGLSFAQGMAAGMKSPASGALMRAGIAGLIAAGSVAAIRGSLGLVEMGLEPIRAEDVFGAGAGLDEATARRFGAAAGEAYSNAWGDSVQQNLATASSALDNALVPSTATQSEIQAVIEQLTAVSELLGVDVTEAAEAAGNMVKNGLADNAEDAFDIIVTGAQQGLNRSGDLLDSLREYSPMFGDLGLSGEEALGLLSQGMEAGARNSDILADGLKELSIRAQDGSAATSGAFEDLGLNADEMGQAFARGGDDARGAMDTILDKLREVEDPMEQNRLGVALLGTMWEDAGNGAGFLAMDLDNLGDSWINVGDTAEDAMNRMQSNASTSLEKTRRTVENTVTQIAGGLAAGWEEPLQDLSDWVLTHRSDIVDWILEAQAAFFDGARAVVEFGATIVEVSGNAAGALAPIVDGLGQAVEAAGILAGNDDLASFGQDIQDAADGMEEWSDNAGTAAEVMREDWIAAIDETEQRVGAWTAPLALRAQLDDAIYGMTMRLDEFSAHVDEAGGTVQINGDTLSAEEALNTVITEVDQSDGTVLINGNPVPAEDALDTVIGLVNAGEGDISIDGDWNPARGALLAAIERVNNSEGTIDVDAHTAGANRAIDFAARTRTAIINVQARNIGSTLGAVVSGRAYGGVVDGLAAGGTVGTGYGVVPAAYPGPGIDNVLWPLASGGQVLSQPLAGGEWVINPISSAQHNATLAAINAGATQRELAALVGGRGGATIAPTFNSYGLNAYESARANEAQMRHVLRDAVPTLAHA